MSKIQNYLDQREAESAAFWQKLLANPGKPVPREEALRRLRASAPAPDEARQPRDLAAEQVELRDLLRIVPWLKLRKPARELGLPASTLDCYLAAPEASAYRPLRDANQADMLWLLLRDTATYIQVALPEAFRQPVPPLPS